MKPGALESPPDPRDLNLSFIAGAPKPIDWSREFRRPKPPRTNQNNSDACTGESASKCHWQITGVEFSVKSIFAYIYQTYGAYLRDSMMQVVNAGQQTISQAPDPNPKTMLNMRSRQGLDPNQALAHKELRAFDTQASPDQLAQALRDWGNCQFGLSVDGNFFANVDYPNPPLPNHPGEGHALAVEGFHTCTDGQHCIIASSSYCEGPHTEHHIRQNYFDSGYVFNQAWVLVPKENLVMVRRYKVNDHGTLGVMLITDGSFDATFYRAKNQEHYEFLLKFYEVPLDAPTINIP